MDKTDKFGEKMSISLDKKASKGQNNMLCTEWVGCIDRYGYGVKRVTWPDGSCALERAHRVAYMLHHKLLRQAVPRMSAEGLELDVSHRCHNKICINPLHLVLEPHSVNMSRNYCASAGSCIEGHTPPCLFPLTI